MTAINTLVPGVIATVDTSFNLTITNTVGGNILVATLGTNSAVNYVTFSNFSTIGAVAISTTFTPSYINFTYFNTIGGNTIVQTYFAQAFDQCYINYLEYQLAERICQKFNFTVPETVANQLARYQLQISKMAEPSDLFQQKISCLGDLRAINYAAANIGQGYYCIWLLKDLYGF